MTLITNLIQIINSLPHKQNTLLIAIDGRGGSGKSTLAEKLRQNLPNTSIVHLDDFAYPETDINRLQKEVITPLKNNIDANYQRHDWGTKKLAEWHMIKPGGIVIIEGVSTLRDELIGNYDFSIWIDCPAEIGFKRGLERDRRVYGVDTKDDWINSWIPEEKKYIATQKPQGRANFIVNYADIEN